MNFYILRNKQGYPFRAFALNEANAKQIAVDAHHTDKIENVDVRESAELCAICFTHEGAASKRTDPEDTENNGWYAVQSDGSRLKQPGIELLECIHLQ